MDEISKRIYKLKQDLKNLDMTDSRIVGKHISFGIPYIFAGNDDIYDDLKNAIASEFDVDEDDVIMVGSAKLGFSIKPEKLWMPIQDDSDIDVAIISERLFDDYWKELLDFNINIKSRSVSEDEKYWRFLKYFFKGWLRPDLFPFDYSKRLRWFKFFDGISYKKYDKRKVSAAVYRNRYFFKHYHALNIKKIRQGVSESE